MLCKDCELYSKYGKDCYWYWDNKKRCEHYESTKQGRIDKMIEEDDDYENNEGN